MTENPDPRRPPRFFERRALIIALIVIAVVSISYFMLRTVDMETASDVTHGGPDPDYEAVETVPRLGMPEETQ